LDGDKTVTVRFEQQFIPPWQGWGGGCSCAIAGSRDTGQTPRAAAGCLLPLLAALLCLFLLRRRRIPQNS
jgi:hypothetical protein